MFKNIIVYKMNRTLNVTKELLEQHLPEFRFTKCEAQDIKKTGFIPYAKATEDLFLEQNGQFLIRIMSEEKILPATVIKEFLDDAVNEYEDKNGKRPTKKEKEAIKEEIIHHLLPRAFSKYNSVLVWIDSVNHLVIVESGSAKKAEDALALIRKSIGTLPVSPLSPKIPPEIEMTKWIKDGEIADNFYLNSEEVHFKSVEDGGEIISKKQDLQSEEILKHIESGKLVTKMSLNFGDNEDMSLLLTNDLAIKKIKMSEMITDKIYEQLGESDDALSEIIASFLIYSGEISKLINSIITAFDCDMADKSYNDEMLSEDENEDDE